MSEREPYADLVGEHAWLEDNYGGQVYATFDELWAEAQKYWLGPLGCYNWPVWVSYDDETYDVGGVVTVGIFMERHGFCRQVEAPATREQEHQVRAAVLKVWAGRAEQHFER